MAMTIEQKIAELENVRDSYDGVRDHCAFIDDYIEYMRKSYKRG